ncbi:YajD family HNH nuclease [Pseudomonadota bacterium]|nr:YajD family HNH nuclease [Pseudomonadota bacterium]
MITDKNKRLDDIVAQAKKYQNEREQTYRERSLKMYPWVCGRCSREFTNTNLQELTVHHRDHNHDNNPSDGSNWELLCIYCHDNEHSRYIEQVRYGNSSGEKEAEKSSHNPFADLAALMKK